MAVVWKLKAFLLENQITPNALAEHSKGQLSKTAIYNLVKDRQPIGIQFATLDTLISTLTDMTKRDVLVEDLVEYRIDKALSWQHHIGILEAVLQLDQDDDK